MLFNCSLPPKPPTFTKEKLFLASEFHLGVILDWPIAIFDSLLGQESLYDHLLKYVRVSLFKTKPFIKNTL